MQQYHVHGEMGSHYPVILLTNRIQPEAIKKEYLDIVEMDPETLMTMVPHLAPGKNKKTPIKEMRAWIQEDFLETVKDFGVQYLLVADAEYYKELAGSKAAQADLGYVRKSPYGDFHVIFIPHHSRVFHDPDTARPQIAQAMQALKAHAEGVYRAPGENIIKFAEYPSTVPAIKAWLDKLLELNQVLTVDIEAFSLKAQTAGIGTISFAWNQHEGIAFAVDYEPIPGATSAPYGRRVRNDAVRALLKDFFVKSHANKIFHNIGYDGTVLIYQLFMEHLVDTEGMLEGLDTILRDGKWDDTKLISYLATNSCSGNHLSLKEQAQEFAGNWAQEDIKDITLIPLAKLLEYNLVDSLSTWYVYIKHRVTLINDNQEEIYQGLFKQSTVDILQMQLTGMPVYMPRVKEVRAILEPIEAGALKRLQENPVALEAQYIGKELLCAKKNAEWKKKRATVDDFPDEPLNPNSPIQVQRALYEVAKLPVISLTDSKQPSTDADTLEKLRNHTDDVVILDFLDALLDYAGVSKILGTFVPALEGALPGPDGWHYLFGNYNLGGTVSGRLSSSEPNLQNLPADGEYGKLIKSCFQAPPGWIMVGLDFNALEDRISALTTKDPNKLAVYLRGFDGHSMRAFSYWGDQMPDIENTVESINSIEKKYPKLRKKSKAPTFALTYQGTWMTLVKNCGFSEAEAKLVERKYHELYAHSTAWVQAKLDQASKDGYITAAFGLRIRTPLLKQVVRGTSKTPKEAEAEGRTAGNALGQSWCLLNSRAYNEFMAMVRKHPEYRLLVRLIAQIHDAGYMLVRDDLATIHFVNTHLVKAVEWQDHPDIYHPEVKLGGKLSIFWPSWREEIEIPNHATEEQIQKVIEAHFQEAA